MGHFCHATFKLVIVQLKATFRLNVTCFVCIQKSAFSKKIVSAFSVNDHVAVQASLSDLSKFCKLGGDQILFVNIRKVSTYSIYQNFVGIMQASLTALLVVYLSIMCTVKVRSV